MNARVALRKIIMDTELDQTQPPSLSRFSTAAFSAVRPGMVSRPISKVPTMGHLKQDSHQIAVRPSDAFLMPIPFSSRRITRCLGATCLPAFSVMNEHDAVC